MEKTSRRILYYIYVFLILLILWSAIQLSKFYFKETQEPVSEPQEIFQDTLTVMLTEIPERFLPFSVVYDEDIFILNQIYRGLTRINSNLIAVPDLAKYWEISDNRKKYTFYLHDSLYFHDGTPLTARDFIRSVEYFVRNYSHNYAVSYYQVIEGIDDFIEGTTPHIRGIRMKSDREVSITLKKPYVPFLKVLSLPQVRILPSHLLKNDITKLSINPVGNGPYQFAGREKDYIILKAFTRNKIYNPEVKYYKLRGLLNADKNIDRYFQKKFDLTFIPDDTLFNSAGHLKYRTNSTFNLVFLGFNCALYPSSNLWFRKMVFFGYDSQTISDLLPESTKPAEFISPFFLPHESNHKPVIQTNFNKAKDILLNSDFIKNKNLPAEISFALDTVNYFVEFSDLLKETGDSLGFNVKNIYFEELDMRSQQSVLDTVNAFIFDWQVDIPDPEFFFHLLFKSDSPMNLFNYKNRQVDSLLKLARYEETGSERLRLYAEVEDILFREAPMRPILYYEEYLFFKDYIQNAFLSRMGLSNMELDKLQINRQLFEEHHWNE